MTVHTEQREKNDQVSFPTVYVLVHAVQGLGLGFTVERGKPLVNDMASFEWELDLSSPAATYAKPYSNNTHSDESHEDR